MTLILSGGVLSQDFIPINNIVLESSGSMIVKNSFLNRDELVVWKTNSDDNVEIPEEFKKHYLEISDHFGQGTIHAKKITFIDKGSVLIGGDEKAINETIKVIEWLHNKEDFYEKSTIKPSILNHFLLYHELSHSLTEKWNKEWENVGNIGYGYDFDSTLHAEIFADLNAVKTIIDFDLYANDEILSLVEYLIVMRTYRVRCCFDIFHYSGVEMKKIRGELVGR